MTDPNVSPLEIVMGHEAGASLKIRAATEIDVVERVEGNRLRGRLTTWRRIVVMTTGEGGSRRAFILSPGPNENELRHGPYSVRGRFDIVEKANAPKMADEVWRSAEVA